MSAIADAGGSMDIEATLTDREIRTLTERLVVLDRDAPGLFTVFSGEGTGYTVDVQATARVRAPTSSSPIPTAAASTTTPHDFSPATVRFPPG